MEISRARARTRIIFWRSLLSAVAVVALAAGVAFGGSSPAQASSVLLCKGYSACDALGMTSHGYAARNGNMYWRMYGGHNCTNYAAYMMVLAGMPNVRPWSNATGNATGWGVGMSRITNTTPTVGSIAWWSPNTGHVAYVEAVLSPTEIIVSEDNWGGDFDWRIISKAGGGWPNGFIHFKDPGGVGTVPEYRAKPTTTTVWTDAGKSKLATTTLMKPGSTAWVEVQYVNTGRNAWEGLQLATQLPDDHDSAIAQGWPAPNRAATQSQAKVAPGQSATFGFAIRIPEGLADGTSVVENFSPVLPTGERVAYGNARLSLVADSRSYFSTQPTPTITGTAAVGRIITAAPGSWAPSVATLAYTWKRDGVVVAGATAKAITLGEGDIGSRFTVTVTATAPKFFTASKTSVSTAVVTTDDFISPNGRFRAVTRSGGVVDVLDRFSGTVNPGAGVMTNYVSRDARTWVPTTGR